MKKILLAGVAALFVVPAVAADLPTKKAPSPAPSDRVRLDRHLFRRQPRLGLGQHQLQFVCLRVTVPPRRTTTGFRDSGSYQHSSFIGGGQIGYRYMFPQRFVIGAEASLDWNSGSSNTIALDGAASIYQSNSYSSRPGRQRRRHRRLCLGRLPALHQGRLGLDQFDGHPHAASIGKTGSLARFRRPTRRSPRPDPSPQRLDHRRRALLSRLAELGSVRPVHVCELWHGERQLPLIRSVQCQHLAQRNSITSGVNLKF